MRLVVTRRPGQAGELEAGARSAGCEIAFLPLTQQLLPEDVRSLTAAIAQLEGGEFDWLLLTSANTVRALKACGWSGRLPGRTRAAAVGPGTARVLGDLAAVGEPWIPQQHSAAGLLAELHRPAAGQRALLPQSAQARPDLAEGLRARGWDLTHIHAYQTVPLTSSMTAQSQSLQDPGPRATVEGDLLEPADLEPGDLVLLTSSTAAEAYAQLQLTHTVPLFAIGEPTAMTMIDLGLATAAVLATPTSAGLTDALNDHGFSSGG